MPLITTADERLARGGSTKMLILGESGIGKTSLAKTLPPQETLVIDMEAGLLALDDSPVDSINVRRQSAEMGMAPWDFLRLFACLVAGPNPAVVDQNKPYSQAHFDYAQQVLGERQAVLGKYNYLFFDSITETARYSFGWAKGQPEAVSEKTGKPDTRGAYGLHGQELVGAQGLFNQLKHTDDKHIIFVGILEQREDDYGRREWVPQIDGGKAGKELPGILDEVITMFEVDPKDGQPPYRAFICHKPNPFNVPAKDRSGKLDLIEEPHLGRLIEKMQGGGRRAPMTYDMPGPADGAGMWGAPQPPAAETTAGTQ